MLKRLHTAAPRLVMALFGGMALTAAVAWWCELRPVTNYVVDVAEGVIVPPDVARASQRPVALYYHRSEEFGRIHQWYDELRIKRAGWPLLALQGMDGPAAARPFLPSTVFLPDSKYLPEFARKHPIPLRPMLPGFAVNTLLYGTVTWCLLALLARLRGKVRSLRKRCTGCGYPRQPETDRCPECGTPA